MISPDAHNLFSQARRSSSAFSLIEVTIALGVVSFALVTLFGLLPTGLNNFRGSMDRSVSAQIAQGIIAKARQTDFTDLTSLQTPAGSPLYFTDEGDSTNMAQAIYVAKVTVETGVGVPSSASFTNSSMARVRVQVAKSPGGSEMPITSTNAAASVHDFSTFLPKM
jgi:uncharacterized protein (TIGR02598 family)